VLSRAWFEQKTQQVRGRAACAKTVLVLGRFKSIKVLVVGDLVADHYVYGQTERVSREAPVLVVRHEREEVQPGGAANVACNVASLGGQVRVVGVLGTDAMGQALRSALRGKGIDVYSAPVEVTETKTRVLAGGVSTTRQQMLRIDRGRMTPHAVSTRRALAARVIRHAQWADAVVVSDYGAGVLGPEVREALALQSKVCVDSRYALSTFLSCEVLKPNEPELAAVLGRPLQGEADVVAAALELRQRQKAKAVVVTRGKHGMVVADARGAEVVPRFGLEDAVDVTGAGDTVIAALALAIGAGASVRAAAKLANVAGALSVQKPGTATVGQAELAAVLK
jgi:D-glycero-beta-D-manno-heptose-7-phosphate kinase